MKQKSNQSTQPANPNEQRYPGELRDLFRFFEAELAWLADLLSDIEETLQRGGLSDLRENQIAYKKLFKNHVGNIDVDDLPF